MNLPFPGILPEPYLNAASAAKHLSISAKKLLTMARTGQIPAHGIGYGQRKMWRFRVSELDLWMQTEVTSGKPPRPSSGEHS
ncbi:MAG: helix-turn-helix domain-containing protein [Edaphobacter sp.]